MTRRPDWNKREGRLKMNSAARISNLKPRFNNYSKSSRRKIMDKDPLMTLMTAMKVMT